MEPISPYTIKKALSTLAQWMQASVKYAMKDLPITVKSSALIDP